ncbi:hypothetical protein [Frankia sp. R82]|uniref:hypothetical protein n=1 Tax=Frankia sp. R82 TaxID=2950553 RepID=UPI0020441050|nr:hypothetical protein [Frankia sp. R82]MCM3887460.1 hypothetical protein [Frankia sp. R82]
MNEDTWALVLDVVGRVQRAIGLDQAPAIVVLDGDRRQILADYDYQHDDTARLAFETRAAEHARNLHLHRFAFAVPRVITPSEPGVISSRAVSHYSLRPGEQEAILWSAYDTADGLDLGLTHYARRPAGQPVFDSPTIFDRPMAAQDHMPGIRLLHLLTATDPSPTFPPEPGPPPESNLP